MLSKFLKFIFRSIYRLSAVLGFLLIIGVAGGFYILSQSSSKTIVQENTLLTLTLQDSYPDYVEESLLKRLLKGEENSLYDLITTLESAEKDPKIKGLVVVLRSTGLGLAQLQELRDAILRFKKAGKSTLIYSDAYGEVDSALMAYYLASTFDEIWMQPIGTVNISGISLEKPYARELLEKLGVTPEFGKRKEYKSFSEMYTNSEPSEAAKEADQAILDSISSQVVETLAKSRKRMPQEVLQLIDNSPYTDLEARDLKLVDTLAHLHTLKPTLESRYGENQPVHFMDFWVYGTTHPAEKVNPDQDHIALIFDSGAIISGDNDGLMSEGFINSTRTYHLFMDAIKNPHVKGIVYRINSPGGSPTASETISSVIHYAKTKGIPVVISMGDYAASGGYWISAEGSKILASSFTLTGSIGVFMGKFVLKDLWEKIGVHWDGVSFGKNSNLASPNTPFTPEEWARMNTFLDRIYSAFVNKVATARKLSLEAAEKLAKGRVWTGEQAQSLGLVDQLGGLHDALIVARKEAKLQVDAPLVIYPRKKGLLEILIEKLTHTPPEDEADSVEFSLRAPLQYWQAFTRLLVQLRPLVNHETLEAPRLEVK